MRRALVAAALVWAMSGCASTADQPSPPFPGWVPAPSKTLTAYADCLKSHQVPVDDVVGTFVLVSSSAQPALTAAEPACQKALAAYHATVLSNESRQIPDEGSYRFIHQVRNCMITRYQISLRAEQTVLVLGQPGITQAQFDACVAEIRAYPTPSA